MSLISVLGTFAAPGTLLAETVNRRANAEPRASSADYLLHLPGISGYHWIDEELIAGLKEGGFKGRIVVHDWPGDDRGLGALFARERNAREAKAVAEAIEKRYRENQLRRCRLDVPAGRIVVTAHSGGAGILVWALERLPEDVQVDTVLLLAPALSPGYDLSVALRRVRGKMYAFTSTSDAVVLGVGTRTFGTMDGVKCDAAGRCGFTVPQSADAAAYQKLVQMPYDRKWMREGNLGDHIGWLGRRFTRNVLTPLALGKEMAPLEKDATTEHTETQRAQRARKED